MSYKSKEELKETRSDYIVEIAKLKIQIDKLQETRMKIIVKIQDGSRELKRMQQSAESLSTSLWRYRG
jgi:hypothetical protein